ncbi:NAD(P)-dependent alcohol dehydrogenase [Nocardioides sp. GY 10127]|uniref:NAD(P)-dependent alcohol dehydrogenase n=1 Tax=Nocardioides sp. GY 10127 TaxID=2569762 RepID=UPI0010A8DBA1|nr:NAD(P)-dependent alcohol dehydrogenase [Nocardioides sp. GY 10127]TIC82766.1 NAD(P)-dependent alcohol dehydrogenase [Nocardioides sp. GY 10127]
MLTVPAYGASDPSQPLHPLTVERRDLGPHDVLIEIGFSGICHSDIHTVRGEWGARDWPITPGHEIAGTVSAVGAEVSRFSVGDRVGVGCMVGSCGTCVACTAGQEQYCKDVVFTYGSTDADGTTTQGGYSTHVVVTESFVLAIPDSLPLDAAAPLLCAGITSYSPLRHWKVGAGSRVAVVGFGGLGHMGVKLASAMGADVTVLSQSLAKKDDSLAFGAQAHHATADPATFAALDSSFDLILNTVSAPLDMDAYLGLLALDGTLVSVGLPPRPISVSAFSLVGARRSWAGSNIGGIAETQEMLDFCGEHGVRPEIELVGAADINTAYERVLASDVRYRFVIDAATFV